MPLHPTWGDVALRLTLTVAAGGIIGFNRGTRGHAAGLRTTILVGLAAAVAMIQANMLLPVGGRTAASFSVMDVMRLPLGILTGVGFIGGGAILKRGNLVLGLTTAATLWVMTVIGLCFGGGQLGLGIAGTVLAVAALSLLRWFDVRIPRDRHAMVVIRAEADPLVINELVGLLAPLGFRAALYRQSASTDPPETRLQFKISWRGKESAGPPLDLMRLLNDRFRVLSFEISEETEH